MENERIVLNISCSLFLLILLVSHANAAAYKWVDENGETHFGDRVPTQYQGDRQEVRAWSDTAQQNDMRAGQSGNSRPAIPRYDNPSQFSNEEWEQRVREMEAQRRKVEESIKAQASKPRDPKRTSPEARTMQERYEEFKARNRKAQADHITPPSRKRSEKPKTYEQKMKEYKASRNCFDRARNVNGGLNAALAESFGCREMKRPRRD